MTVQDVKKSELSSLIDHAFKLAVIVVIPWGVWVTSNIVHFKAFESKGDRFSAYDAYELELRIDKRIDALPPQDFRDQMKSMQLRLDEIYTFQRNFADEITRDFVRKDELKD